ncbi:iron-hydroxamate ABC transporter substrate-binding protein [Brevibacillus laterosporus]|uniref:iron-hydroxamate ABC transporter substrate-binding protein n=1 Tax=Brevibacillus laterosporus TaxID=1465 RepID=UPI0026544022|nr:iron-hydroxamate ABC transporter substrate-binding protein [Brevibacillus laterosporus]MDN9010481.1 iron-hydroxamate ABC transporter substrate-binding protein [Brevibacillus laterosporus]MDO0941610.1 iron-hydroxamate ABC transporter substrate-binding protein [Brevibacillus laterosporus]
MKEKLLILMCILTIFALSACGQSTPQSNTESAKGQTVEQSADKKEPRIASMSIHLTNNLLALGITPVGSVIGGDLKSFLPHVADRLKDTKPLGVVADPDMEALLALKPDVIYADQQYAGKDLSKYEKIAETHSFNLDDGTWRDTLKKVGKLVNREQQAEAFIKDYEAQAERVKKLVQSKIGDGTVMGIRVTGKELRVFSTRRPMGPLLYDDLGLKPAKGVEKLNKKKAFEVISQEVLPDFDADAIFVIVNNRGGAHKMFEQLQSNPIWKDLKAVKANHVYMIPEQPWLDYSALGAKMALDHAEKIFSK